MIQAAATMHLIWGQSYEKLRVVKTAFKLPYSEKANCVVVMTRLCFVLIFLKEKNLPCGLEIVDIGAGLVFSSLCVTKIATRTLPPCKSN